MKKLYISAVMMAGTTMAMAQSFTENSSLLTGSYHSGGVTAVTDMNNDGLDDIVIMDQSKNLNIAYQQSNGTFSVSSFGTVASGSQWGMCIGDIDNDGHKDVLSGGYYDDVHIVNINGPGSYAQSDYAWANIFAQGSNFADIDNDGWLDAFVCHDDGHSAILHNDGTGFMTNGASMMDLVFYPETNGNDNSGNYGTVWTDFDRDGDIDLFIAKCRQVVNDPLDPRRTNILMLNDGNNNYSHHNAATGVAHAAERGLVNLQQSWTSDFADLDNDGDFDCMLTTHTNTIEIYENDGNGYFTDATAGSGLAYPGFFLQAKFHDFDNDGFLDLIHAGGDHRYFKNNGNMTFTLMNNMFPASDVMHSFSIGDLNHDGSLDVYAVYGDGYVDPDNAHADKIFLNNGNNNNFVVFDLEGTISNRDAAGALVEIHGAWGTQIREVRDGESYGITNMSMCHFGLGSATTIDEAIIYWPSGLVTTIANPAINTWHNLIENQCSVAAPTISAPQGTIFCPGGSVNLQASGTDLTYVWNNGSTSSNITVSEPGSYFVTATDATGCSTISQAITVAYESQNPPAIQVNGELHICDNSSVELVATQGSGYTWSNGETTQSITVTEAGDYSVQVQGVCNLLTSEVVSVAVSAAPTSPSLTNISIDANTSATFTVTGGNMVSWYDSANGTTPIATGSSFTTPALTQTTSYWVEDAILYDGDDFTGGKTDWTQNSTGVYQSNASYYLIFDAHEDLTINSVKVYAQGEATRTIAVVDAAGNTIQTGDFLIPNGESVVTLNFSVPQGTGYGLRCFNYNNQGPMLWRDKDLNAAFGFPFQLGTLATITNTNVAGADTDNYYYFFFDWVIEKPDFTCVSQRAEVQAIVADVSELKDVNSMELFPNPAVTSTTIAMNVNGNHRYDVSLIDPMGRMVWTRSFTCNTGRNTLEMDLDALAAGMYQVRVSEGGRFATQKLIVE